MLPRHGGDVESDVGITAATQLQRAGPQRDGPRLDHIILPLQMVLAAIAIGNECQLGADAGGLRSAPQGACMETGLLVHLGTGIWELGPLHGPISAHLY